MKICLNFSSVLNFFILDGFFSKLIHLFFKKYPVLSFYFQGLSI